MFLHRGTLSSSKKKKKKKKEKGKGKKEKKEVSFLVFPVHLHLSDTPLCTRFWLSLVYIINVK